MILIKNSAPDASSLGATNGLIMFAMVRYSRRLHAYDWSLTPSLTVLRPCILPCAHKYDICYIGRFRLAAYALLLGRHHSQHRVRRGLALASDRGRNEGHPKPSAIVGFTISCSSINHWTGHSHATIMLYVLDVVCIFPLI